MKLQNLLWASILGVGLIGCGDDGGGGGGGGGGSFDSIANAIENPSGTLTADNVGGVAEEYGNVASSGAGGDRRGGQQSIDQTTPCGTSGDITVSGSGDQSGGSADLTYNDCCYAADCCTSGDGTWFYSTEAGATYSYCGTFDLTYDCSGTSATLAYSGCFSTSGSWTYVVTYEGQTYAVSGSYSGGNGTISITDSTGTYECTVTDGSGSCTGAGKISWGSSGDSGSASE